jgi:hypothetical protein
MTFREKMLWGSLAATIAIWGWYFWGFVSALKGPTFDAGAEVGSFIFAIVALIVVQIVVAVVLAISSPAEASAPADERDRAIARRSATKAYYLLMAGMIMVGIVMPFSYRGWSITNAALLALVIADMVRYGAIIVDYRRGWHG